MARGRVYTWRENKNNIIGKELVLEELELAELDPLRNGLRGTYVNVSNESVIPILGAEFTKKIENVEPDEIGNYLFRPLRGGTRIDKLTAHDSRVIMQYVEASRFGEVNSYHHATIFAQHINHLLSLIGQKPLPSVTIRVNCHNGLERTECGSVDGLYCEKHQKWRPMQGGHYRISKPKEGKFNEYRSIRSNGEIHFGPGRNLMSGGLLADLAQCSYRNNASHNPGVIYHEYGHHLNHHISDFRSNSLKLPARRSNVKSALDEGLCDYWAASFMGTPYIWCAHHRHSDTVVHRRSLTSSESADNFDRSPEADPHTNGVLISSALWEARQAMGADLDLAVMFAQVNIGKLFDQNYRPSITGTREIRNNSALFFSTLLDGLSSIDLHKYEHILTNIFRKRRFIAGNRLRRAGSGKLINRVITMNEIPTKQFTPMAPDVENPPESICLGEIMSPEDLRQQLIIHSPFDFSAVGDVMLGDRSNSAIKQYGPDYTFHYVRPIFEKSNIVLANLEGPIAEKSKSTNRRYSYKVSPSHTRILRRAGINLVSLANNHILDCGRDGVIETIQSLDKHDIGYVGGGINREEAHRPKIIEVGTLKIGVLGYYWNKRTAAKRNSPGSAMDTFERYERDLNKLKPLVDKIIVTVHWGTPYEREPKEETIEKAKSFVDLGADVVVGHHPHIVQRVDIYRGKPIFYSIGNFAFGSGNSKAESIIVSGRFKKSQLEIEVFPVYVKNRDPLVDYQPKVLVASAGKSALERLKDMSPSIAKYAKINENSMSIVLPN